MITNGLHYIQQIVYVTYMEITYDIGHFAKLTYRRIILLVTRDVDHVALKKDGSHRLIVFIHGYWGDRENFTYLSRDLREFGNQLFISYNTMQDIPTSAQAVKVVLDQFLDQNPHITEVGIVSHSMGGLVANELIYHQERSRSYSFCVTLGTPFKGTELAHIGFGTSAVQMKPGSPFTEKLWTSIHEREKTSHFTLSAEKDYIVPPTLLKCGMTKTVPTTHLGLLRHESARNEIKQWIQQHATNY